MLPKSENRYTTYWKKKNFDPNYIKKEKSQSKLSKAMTNKRLYGTPWLIQKELIEIPCGSPSVL